MTNIGHFRAAGKHLDKATTWMHGFGFVRPAYGCTYVDGRGLLQHLAASVLEPRCRCSLCMGNQARVLAIATVMSTST